MDRTDLRFGVLVVFLVFVSFFLQLGEGGYEESRWALLGAGVAIVSWFVYRLCRKMKHGY